MTKRLVFWLLFSTMFILPKKLKEQWYFGRNLFALEPKVVTNLRWQTHRHQRKPDRYLQVVFLVYSDKWLAFKMKLKSIKHHFHPTHSQKKRRKRNFSMFQESRVDRRPQNVCVSSIHANLQHVLFCTKLSIVKSRRSQFSGLHFGERIASLRVSMEWIMCLRDPDHPRLI